MELRNVYILSQNIANNPNDFPAEKIEECFIEYGKSQFDKALEESGKWTEINGFAELPEGSWLVQIAEPIQGSKIHAARKMINDSKSGIGTVASHFYFDAPKIVAYRPLPKEA